MKSLKPPSKLDIIATARRYSLNPRFRKARAFALFEAGFSAPEANLLLNGKLKANSLQTYYAEWTNER